MLEEKIGLSPGTLIHVGDTGSKSCKITKIEYSDGAFSRNENVDVKTIDVSNKEGLHWVHVEGVHDAVIMQEIGNVFGLHSLVLEDIMNTEHRPKAEDNKDSLFFTFKLFSFDLSDNYRHSDQMSILLGDNWVLSFVEEKTTLFDFIIGNIKEGKGEIKHKNIDYLFYRLIDTVVDNYFAFKECYSDAIDELEEEVLDSPTHAVLQKNRLLKRDLMSFRKVINATREAVNNLMLFDSDLLTSDTNRYFRDVKDHLIYISESVEGYRETLGSITDLYHSSLGQKTNQIMQVLTIISTIFIPLTFIAGIYGMNFNNMPELQWGNGYYFVLSLMAVITGGMLYYFKRKRWL